MKKMVIIILMLSVIGGIVYKMFLDDKVKGEKDTLIMAFGDSLTYGKGDRDEEGYIGILERNLNGRYQDRSFVIKNFGVPGRKSSGVLNELSNIHTTEKLNEANHFIVFIGTNDLIKSNGGDYSPLNHDKIMKGFYEYKRNMKAILELLRTANKSAPIVVVGIYNPYPDGEKIESYIDEWNEATEEIAKSQKNTVFVGTNDLFKGKNKSDYFSDSLHLDEDGYELLANRIMNQHNFAKNE
ncbi:Lysophospholipase L1 [Bacillus sp. cl95]|nr:Lysophospholipase L1 [Bacillus sp. UNCCL13]SFQ60731.1 Lysophospholipase L1 [Bacillus sp. cl95]